MTTLPLTFPLATFGELLRRWRRWQGLTQAELGQLLEPKARVSTVCCWENDIRRPSRRYLGQLVDLTGIPAGLALGPPLQEFQTWTVAPPPPEAPRKPLACSDTVSLDRKEPHA